VPSLSRTEFASAVTAITSAFGDPTRREVYLWVHGRSDGVTASEVAEQFELHANVARHQLDKLTAGGYLEIGTVRAAGGAGRPSKRYRTVADEVGLDVPVGQDDMLVNLLGRALAELGEQRAAALAEEVGGEYGRAMAAEHPAICAVDRGMVRGMLESLHGETSVDLVRSTPGGVDRCVTSVGHDR